MQNIRLTIQYDGTRYLGWQRPEKDGYSRTVSFRITEIIKKITGEEIVLFGGAKTEPGVHAAAQTANFLTCSPLGPSEFASSINKYLPSDIAVLHADSVPERFRADLNAISRTYEFHCCTAPVYNVFLQKYTANVYPAPDTELMRRSVSLLTGKHDFSSFSSVRKKKGTQKELLDISFSSSGASLTIRLTASDFLYQMPALITGTLLEIGQGLRTPESITDILAGKEKAGSFCEAKGLLLKSIQYDKDHKNNPAI